MRVRDAREKRLRDNSVENSVKHFQFNANWRKLFGELGQIFLTETVFALNQNPVQPLILFNAKTKRRKENGASVSICILSNLRFFKFQNWLATTHACHKNLGVVENLDSQRKALRQSVSVRLRTAIFQEASVTCPFCGLEKLGSLQVHHIDEDRANSTPENLIAVCGSCHDQITKGLKSEADVRMTKRMLQSGFHPFAKKTVPTGDTVQVSGTNNSGIIANRVTIHGKAKTGKIIVPGTIGAHPREYNYVEYLVKRLTKFREAGTSYGQKRKGKLHDGGTRSILGDQLGGLPKDQPIELFERVVAHIKGKIDNTALGRNRRSRGQHNYHEFHQHGLLDDDAE